MSMLAVGVYDPEIEKGKLESLIEKESNLLDLLERIKNQKNFKAGLEGKWEKDGTKEIFDKIDEIVSTTSDLNDINEATEHKGPEFLDKILRDRRKSIQDLINLLKSRNLDIDNLDPVTKAGVTTLQKVLRDLKDTANEIKETEKTLLEHSDDQSHSHHEVVKARLRKHLAELYRSKFGVKFSFGSSFSLNAVTHALALPSFALVMEEVEHGLVMAERATAEDMPGVEKALKGVASVLEGAHAAVVAEALLGLSAIIGFGISLYQAKALNERLKKLGVGDIGLAARTQKIALATGIFLTRFAILGVAVGLMFAAVATVASASTLLGVVLAVNLFQEFVNLGIAKNTLSAVEKKWKALDDEVRGLQAQLNDQNIPLGRKLKLIDELKTKQDALGYTEKAVNYLQDQVNESLTKRNKLLYNTTAAVFIAIAPVFPPALIIGVAMLTVPLVIGISRFLDEKLNSGRLTKAIADSAIGQLITNSKLYRTLFPDSQPSNRKANANSNNVDLSVSEKSVTEPENEFKPAAKSLNNRGLAAGRRYSSANAEDTGEMKIAHMRRLHRRHSDASASLVDQSRAIKGLDVKDNNAPNQNRLK